MKDIELKTALEIDEHDKLVFLAGAVAAMAAFRHGAPLALLGEIDNWGRYALKDIFGQWGESPGWRDHGVDVFDRFWSSAVESSDI